MLTSAIKVITGNISGTGNNYFYVADQSGYYLANLWCTNYDVATDVKIIGISKQGSVWIGWLESAKSGSFPVGQIWVKY